MEKTLLEYKKEYESYYLRSTSKTWVFSQMFGEQYNELDSCSESDEGRNDTSISSLAFNKTGDYLAAGYTSGQIVILKQKENENIYELYCEFKSHDSGFDFLTSVEIEEKINMVRWYPFPQRGLQRLLTTNDKTIKLFKLGEKYAGYGEKRHLKVFSKIDRVFEGGHVYNINAISFSSDGETFISSDDLRVNLWNIDVNDEALSTVDIKPENMDDVSEVITCTDFHPTIPSTFIYSSNKGVVRLCDLRASALCEKKARSFTSQVEIGGFFQDLATVIGNIKFSPCGRFIASRDYLTIKIWDLRQESSPLRNIMIDDDIIGRLCELYETEAIFDRFDISWSNNSEQLLTGSYNNMFYIFDSFGDGKYPMKAIRPMDSMQDENYQMSPQKILHSLWHPKTELLILASKGNGYLYQRND